MEEVEGPGSPCCLPLAASLYMPGLHFLGAHDGAKAVAWGARGCQIQKSCQ